MSINYPGVVKRTPLTRKTPLRAKPREGKAKGKRNPMPPGVADEVLRRDGYTCQARRFGLVHRCSGRLEIHHLRNRGMGGGGQQVHDLANLLTVCSWANHWVAEHPAEAEPLGLYVRH